MKFQLSRRTTYISLSITSAINLIIYLISYFNFTAKLFYLNIIQTIFLTGSTFEELKSLMKHHFLYFCGYRNNQLVLTGLNIKRLGLNGIAVVRPTLQLILIKCYYCLIVLKLFDKNPFKKNITGKFPGSKIKMKLMPERRNVRQILKRKTN